LRILRAGRTVKGVYQLPEGKPVKPETVDKYQQFCLEPFDMFSMLLVEYELRTPRCATHSAGTDTVTETLLVFAGRIDRNRRRATRVNISEVSLLPVLASLLR
jgi:hypothetical protein